MTHKIMKTLCLLSVFFYVSLVQAKVYLVTVGISDYPGTKNDLRLAYNDAATMQWLYKENRNSSIKLLMNEKATVANVKSAMQDMFGRASANDIVVFYFSGHGIKGGFACYDGFLRYGDISKIMSSSKSKNKMIFADACFSGAFRDNSKVSSKYKSLGNNIMLFLSCRSNELSIENPKKTNGLFTYALQHGLRGGADVDRDSVVTAKELFNYVSTKVNKDSNGKQHPVMWGKFPNKMPVMKWKKDE